MVTINLTLLVELGLFLVFLWGTQKYILAPVVKNLDDREDSIQADHAIADKNSHEAESLEQEYRHEIALIRRQSDDQVRSAQQESQQEHQTFLIAERAKAEEAVSQVRDEAQAMAGGQQSAMDAAIPELVEEIATKLRSGGNS